MSTRTAVYVTAESRNIEHAAALHEHTRGSLSDHSGLAPATIANAFAGKPIPIEAALRICVALGGVRLTKMFGVAFPYNVPLGVDPIDDPDPEPIAHDTAA